MGLLDWAQTPQGIGLLSAAAGAMAGARRGRPWNTAGIGLSTGIGGYQQAIDMQRQDVERKRQEMQQEQTKNALMNAYKAGIVKRKTETPAQYNAGGKTFGTMQEAEQYARAFDPRQELGAALYGEFGGKEPLANNIDFSQYAGAPFVAPDLNPMMGIDTVPGTVQEVDEYDPRKAAMAMLESGNVDAMNAGFRLLSEVPKGQEFGTTPFIGKDGKAYLIGKNGAIMETGLRGPEKDIDYNKPFLPDGTPNAAYQAWKLSDSKAGASSVSVNTGQKGLDNELKLRGDFRSEPVYKAHQEMKSAYSQVRQALGQQSPAGDLAGATKIMKLLDPGSVVRESELGMAMAASGMLDRVQNYATNIINGTKLTPTQRADFQRLADALYQESVSQYNAKGEEYRGFANDYGLSPERITGKPDEFKPADKTHKNNPQRGFALPPNPKQYEGKVLRDTVSGKRFKSVGGKWQEVR